MTMNDEGKNRRSDGGLQRELKKKRPFESAEQEAVLNVMRTSDRFDIQFSRLFREHGLTGSQYNVLRILRGEGRPMPSLEVADRMLSAMPGITGLVDRLETLGLVTRERCTEDRRVVYVAITKQGLDILAKLDAPVAELHEKLVGHLTKAELKELSRLLEKARRSLAE